MSLDGSDNTDPPPSATLKLDVASMVRVEQPGNVLVFAQSTSTHFPVVRRTIGTQGTAELAGKRRRNPPTYTCGNCRTTFTTKANGVRHVLAHYDIKPFVCSCDRSFGAREDLKRHCRASKCVFVDRSQEFVAFLMLPIPSAEVFISSP